MKAVCIKIFQRNMSKNKHAVAKKMNDSRVCSTSFPVVVKHDFSLLTSGLICLNTLMSL